MRSRILTLLFAFLLLGMQHDAQLHALTHFGDQLQRPHDQGLQLPVDETPCAICALFAGGSTAIARRQRNAFRACRRLRRTAGRDAVACGLASHLLP